MNRFFVELDVSSSYATDAPTLQILISGAVVESFAVTGDVTQAFQLEFSDLLNFPSSLQFRFSDASGEAGRSVTINGLRVSRHLSFCRSFKR